MNDPTSNLDKTYINISLFYLKKILGSSFPNPPVFSILVESNKSFKDNRIISFGFTSFTGRPHAESNAIENVKFRKNKIYSLYSTLEPCCHNGRDESCVSKILNSKRIDRVIFSLRDPDPRVNGKGKKKLLKNNIYVKSDVLKELGSDFYQGYILNRTQRRPKVILKLAMTIDGYISTKKNKRTKITNPQSDSYSDSLRSEVDAILVGSKTVKIDNCVLKCKSSSFLKNSPIRVILNKKLDLNINSKIFLDCEEYRTIIFSNVFDKKKLKIYEDKKVEVISFSKNDFNLKEILKKLSNLGVTNLLVEGGGEIFSSFFNQRLFDQVYIFRSNFFSGSNGTKALEKKIDSSVLKLFKLETKRFGNDSLEIYKC